MEYKTLKTCECKVGMQVILSNPDPFYRLGMSNPAVGTSYFCKGTITSVHSGGAVDVIWENHHKNSYKNDELSLADDSFDRMVSIW